MFRLWEDCTLMKTYQELEDSFNRKVKYLQEHCTHKETTEWLPYLWGPGHFSGETKSCKTCCKILERRGVNTTGIGGSTSSDLDKFIIC